MHTAAALREIITTRPVAAPTMGRAACGRPAPSSLDTLVAAAPANATSFSNLLLIWIECSDEAEVLTAAVYWINKRYLLVHRDGVNALRARSRCERSQWVMRTCNAHLEGEHKPAERECYAHRGNMCGWVRQIPGHEDHPCITAQQMCRPP